MGAVELFIHLCRMGAALWVDLADGYQFVLHRRDGIYAPWLDAAITALGVRGFVPEYSQSASRLILTYDLRQAAASNHPLCSANIVAVSHRQLRQTVLLMEPPGSIASRPTRGTPVEAQWRWRAIPLGILENLFLCLDFTKRIKREAAILLPSHDPAVLDRHPGGLVE
jgi:hypothetical protein